VPPQQQHSAALSTVGLKAMGGAGVAPANSPFDLYYNPASDNFEEITCLQASHAQPRSAKTHLTAFMGYNRHRLPPVRPERQCGNILPVLRIIPLPDRQKARSLLTRQKQQGRSAQEFQQASLTGMPVSLFQCKPAGQGAEGEKAPLASFAGTSYKPFHVLRKRRVHV